MEIRTTRNGDVVTIIPVGDIDYVTAPEIDAVVEAEAPGAGTIVFDMANVAYISSAGLRSILNADELMEEKDGIRLINVCAEVKAIFDMTNFSQVLKIE